MPQLSKAAAEPPSFALYNIRFLSLSPNQQQRRQWQRKVANVQALCHACTIVGVVETHVSPRRAHRFFGQHISGVEHYYVDGMAIFVQKQWAVEKKPHLHKVVDGAIIALSWKDSDGKACWLFFFRLDAFKEKTRRQQLAEATKWAHAHVGAKDWTAFAGDRNFTCSTDERQSSAKTAWCPSIEMNNAWQKWLTSLGGAEVIQQAEFTWGRIFKSTKGAEAETAEDGDQPRQEDSLDDEQLAAAIAAADRAGVQGEAVRESEETGEGWSYATLDVVGTNHLYGDRQISYKPVARRGDEIPAPRASDHWPIELHWHRKDGPRRRQKKKAEGYVRKPIPRWLVKDAAFNEALRDHLQDALCENRRTLRGLAALAAFGEIVYSFAKEYREHHVIRAQTPEHKLEICLEVRKLLSSRRLGRKEEEHLARLCKIYPKVADIVELEVDAETSGCSIVPEETEEALLACCRSVWRARLQRPAPNPERKSTKRSTTRASKPSRTTAGQQTRSNS